MQNYKLERGVKKKLSPLRRQRTVAPSKILHTYIHIYNTMNLHLFLKTVFFSAKVEVIKTILIGYSAFTQSLAEPISLSEI
jgi:hypothetical protein